MAIYAWPGEVVEIVEARIAPLWIERRRGEIRRHFTEPKRTTRTVELNATVGWFVKLKQVEGGRMLYDGKWTEMHSLRADDGIKELNDVFAKVVGTEELEKFSTWNKKDGPEATTLWPHMKQKEAA